MKGLFISEEEGMETRVYAVDNHNGERKPWSIDDESFISEAETAGTVWTLSGFEISLNMGHINPNDMMIRFISVSKSQYSKCEVCGHNHTFYKEMV